MSWSRGESRPLRPTPWTRVCSPLNRNAEGPKSEDSAHLCFVIVKSNMSRPVHRINCTCEFVRVSATSFSHVSPQWTTLQAFRDGSETLTNSITRSHLDCLKTFSGTKMVLVLMLAISHRSYLLR